MGNQKEIWKPVSFKGKKPGVKYAVSNQGRFGVITDKKGTVEVRTFQPQDGGYRYNYKVDGKSKGLFIYKEVAKAFVNKPSPKHSMVIRKDHNYLNDKPSNLKWVTPQEHTQHVKMSPNSINSRKRRAITVSATAKVFNEKKVLEVKKLIWDPKRKLTYKQIAAKYKVSEMQIYRIKSGELWYHVKVNNEPENKRYKQNVQNIAFQEKLQERKNKVAVKKSAKTRR